MSHCSRCPTLLSVKANHLFPCSLTLYPSCSGHLVPVLILTHHSLHYPPFSSLTPLDVICHINANSFSYTIIIFYFILRKLFSELLHSIFQHKSHHYDTFHLPTTIGSYFPNHPEVPTLESPTPKILPHPQFPSHMGSDPFPPHMSLLCVLFGKCQALQQIFVDTVDLL